MKNVKYIDDDIYEFSGFIVTKDDYGFDLKISDTVTDIDSIYSTNFRMMVQNGSIAEEGQIARFSANQIVDYYMFRDSPKKDFEKLLDDYEFPSENKSRKPYVCLDGAFSSKESFWKILYPSSVGSLGPLDALRLNRKGFILYMPNGEIYGSTNIFEYKLHKSVEDINKIWQRASQSEKYKLLEDLQKSAKTANAALESIYEKIKIVSPDKIVPDVQKTKDGFKVSLFLNMHSSLALS